jgi:hypothetical protein
MELARPALVIGTALVLVAASTATAATAAPAPSTAVTTHEVTVVMVDPAGANVDYTSAEALHALAVVDSFYARETGGAVRFHVARLLDWSQPGAGVRCDDFDSLLDFAARRAGFVPGPDAHLIAMTPGGAGCDYALGEQAGGQHDGGRVTVSTTDPTTIAHELGHNLSLHHTASLSCTGGWDPGTSSGLPTSCTRDEYGNHSDIMGGGFTFYPFSPGSLARLGLTGRDVVPACGAPRRVTIDTMSASTDAARIIHWRDPAHPSTSYYVQFRDAADNREYDALYPSPSAGDDDAPTGVQVYRTDPGDAAAAAVLSRPGDSSRARQRIRSGERVPLADGMSVSVTSIDGNRHTATVDVQIPCAAPAPAGGPDGAPGSTEPSGDRPLVLADRARA